MYLAVKKWPNMASCPVDMPAEWPAEVVELGESQTLPSGDYVLMTTAEYEAHRALYRADYDVYAAANGIE